MLNQRKSKRLEITVPCRLKLIGTAKHSQHIKAFTRNISPVGLSTELRVSVTNGAFHIQEGEERIFLIPYLVLGKKEVALEITIPPNDEKIKAKGRVVWYDLSSREASYFLKAGIFLKEMEDEDRKRWEAFVKNKALETGKIWQYIQIVSSFTFIAGIIIFIAGFSGKLVTISKIGVFFSIIGLIGFLLAWWQHRRFMLFKKFKLF